MHVLTYLVLSQFLARDLHDKVKREIDGLDSTLAFWQYKCMLVLLSAEGHQQRIYESMNLLMRQLPVCAGSNQVTRRCQNSKGTIHMLLKLLFTLRYFLYPRLFLGRYS